MKLIYKEVKETVIHNFNMNIFVSLMLLSAYTYDHIEIVKLELLLGVTLSLVNGFLVTFIVLLINGLLKRKNLTQSHNVIHSNRLGIFAFCIGSVTPFLMYNEYSVYGFSVFVFYTAYRNFKSFGKVLVASLKPNTIVKRRNLIDFGYFYTNLVITFTIANLLLFAIYSDLGLNPPFNFQSSQVLFDSLYFTAITMTTTGFGDVVPLTGVARALVIIESFTSYLLLGLMIGILSKGVDLSKDE